MSYTKTSAFWYRPDTAGVNDSDYTGPNRFWYRGAGAELAAGYEYLAADPLQVSRIAAEILVSPALPQLMQVSRIAAEVLYSAATATRRTPQFFLIL